ncbi:MAG: cysteine--tRNA ligase [Candidatus Moraniibacteriota bacterium]
MLKLYNSLGRKKQVFKPINKNVVNIYSCGPTVYDYPHIGNYRSYIVWDLLKRFLEYSGYKTKVVKNITDVGHLTEEETESGEDKMEKAARREKKDPLEIAKFYTQVFVAEEKKLNILPPDFQPRATREIKMMQEIIKALVRKGFAYDSADGVYFNVAKFRGYGKLSGNTPRKILAGARVEINENKKHPADFALWKKRIGKNRRHSLYWPSPWGDGFPGWHIECSAMALRYLGKTIDIHTGGQDNKFPHHESEIAQSEAYTGKPLSRFWLHAGLMDVEGKKMAKSLGNFYTLQDIEKKGVHPLAYRFWTFTAHYRSPMNFSWKGLKEASDNWEKIVEFYSNYVIPAKAGIQKKNSEFFLDPRVKPEDDNKKYLEKNDQQFTAALDDDLNTPKAIAMLLQAIKGAHKDPGKIPAAIYLIKKWDQVLGILPKKLPKKPKVTIPAKVKKLLADRQKARDNKDYKKSDVLRKRIEKIGYEVIDGIKGKSMVKPVAQTRPRLLPKK